ncbi:MAG TPA: GAF domain-containing protein [Solirubrobacteraceae bacterium]|nr:GAF domain-containing protein [Solirubrobacteraceae bacterium]
MPSTWLAVEAGTDLLARARQIQRSWDRLLGEGALGPDLPPQATAGMRATIVESWRRTLATGLDPTDLLPPIEAEEFEVRERWLENPLGSAAHVLAAQLRAVAEETQSLVVVTDASGLLLHVDGADWLKDRAREMNLLEGARYSETTDGTNGIGTALAADHALQVFAFEHFNQRHHDWICSGAPVHDPVSGRIVGLIDLSSLWKIAHPRSLELVTTAAKTVERFLSDIQRDQDARLRRRYGDLTTKSTDLLVNRQGYVLIGDDAARAKPLDLPESGGEIAMHDGSLAVAEPLGQGEAYLVRRLASRRAGAAQGEARAHELARQRAAASRAGDPGRAREVESGFPSSGEAKRLSAYLEAAIDCVIVADASGQIVEFNPAAERTFGYSREEAVGRTMAELIVPPSLRERHIAAFARFVETSQGSMLGRRVELTGMRADGSEFPVELALSQVEAEPVLICGALRDISAAKQAENRLRELAEEQAALRQVATLVAHESSPDRLVAVVAEQVALVFDVPLVRLIRYEPAAAVVVGGFSESDDEPFPIGSRWQLDTPGVVATIRNTGRAARVEDYTRAPGDGAGAVRAAGMRSAVGSPIVVEGRVWGAIVLLSPRSGSLPDDTGARLADFTELVATALANSESRAALSQLADEQAALRRVATLVAREASPVELLETVAQEVARVLDVEAIGILRFEPDRTATLVAQSHTPWDPPPLGTNFTLEGENVVTAVFRTREAARLDDWAKATGPVADMARVLGIRSSVATPIVVEGRLWGTLIAVTSESEPIQRETDSRIGEFTELVATAIANAGARDELAASEARARGLAYEQAALRRVATMVARTPVSEQLFSTVAREVASVLDVPGVIVTRYEPDGTAVTVGEAFGPDLAGAEQFLGIGTPMPPDPGTLTALVFDTHDPARVDDLSTSPGTVGEVARAAELGSGCAGPIVVNGVVWGKMCVFSRVGTVLPAGTEDRLHDFVELVATAIANYEARAELAASETHARELADEQAALRRVATLVAREPASEAFFSAVAREVASVLHVPGALVERFEADGASVSIGAAYDSDFSGADRLLGVGVRTPPDSGSLTAQVFETKHAARVDDFSTLPGPVGDAARAAGIGSGCAGPIVVNRGLWGMLAVFSRAGTRLPEGIENRLHDFIELIATAIANYEARADLAASETRARELADEQAALRRVATLVARGVSPGEMFSAVTNEMAQLFGCPQACVGRFEPDGSAMVVVGVSDGSRKVSIGSRWQLQDYMASTRVYRTGHPVRVERSDLEHVSGPMADVLREIGAVSNVGAPIVVEGKRWGFVTVTDVKKRLPADTEKRLEKFAELVATSIANAESRAELAASEARARKLAEEQASLRRVATLVAEGAKSEAVFSAVAHEVAQVFGVQHVTVCRYEPETILVLSSFQAPESAGVPSPFPAGRRLPLDVPSLPAAVHRTGEPARIDEFTAPDGLYAVARQAGLTAAVGVPIVVDGTLWGAINIASTKNERFLPGAEERLARFTELIATAVSNAAIRGKLAASEARARKLAEEQASLRRVATLVAEGPAPTEVFDAVIAEVGQLLGAAQIGLARYESEHEISVLAIRGQSPEILRAGMRLPLDGDSVNARILRTGRSARLNFAEEGSGSVAEVVRRDNVNATVGAPIVVDGAVWGMIGASWRGDDEPPADAEERLAQFADLVATAVSNAAMRGELAASRARVIAAADESRRRIERDLHDGAQQRLVTLAVALRRAEAKVPVGSDELRAEVSHVAEGLKTAVDELRELSQGIHPAELTHGGLSPALKALGRRSAVRVELDVPFEDRLPDQVEVAVYYTVSEALTNASKHANATRVWVSVSIEDDVLLLSIRDDGAGGADPRRGSGLTGLRDRIEALGGRIRIESQTGSGTIIEVEIPIA